MTRVGAVDRGTVRTRVPSRAWRRLRRRRVGGAMATWRRAVAAVVVLASAVGATAFSPASTSEHSGLPSTGELTEYVARTFDNASRVWLQDDVYRGVVGDAPSLNRYAFVEGSPVTFTDVWGFFRSASDVDAFMATHDPNKGKPLRLVVRDWMEDNPGQVTGIVTGVAFGVACTVATAGAGLVVCGMAAGAISNAMGGGVDYFNNTAPEDRSLGDFAWHETKAALVGAASGLVGEGLGVVVTGAARPLLSSASRALSDALTGGVASSTDDIARVTLRSTVGDVAAGVKQQWGGSFNFKSRVTTEAPTTGPSTLVGRPGASADDVERSLLATVTQEGRTAGVLSVDGELTTLVSGKSPLPNYAASGHVEGQAALLMRESGVSSAELHIDNPNGVCGYCVAQVPTLLPEGAELIVRTPLGTVTPSARWFNGRTFVGNAANPKGQ